MVKLRNITRDNKHIRCDYYPESEKEHGEVIVEIDSGDLVEIKCTEYERALGTTVYARYAALKLNKIKGQEQLPTKASFVWY